MTKDELDELERAARHLDNLGCCQEARVVRAAARRLQAVETAGGLTAERREYIKKVRNCVPMIEPDAGARETQEVIDELLASHDHLAAEVERLTAAGWKAAVELTYLIEQVAAKDGSSVVRATNALKEALNWDGLLKSRKARRLAEGASDEH